MTPEQIAALAPGERIYRWVWVGLGETHDIQEMTVVRVNRVTVTVDTNHHGRVRVRHADIQGRVTWSSQDKENVTA